MGTGMSLFFNTNLIEVITVFSPPSRWTAEQKLEMAMQTLEPGMTVSKVSCQADLEATQLFQWKKAYSEGSLVAVGAIGPFVLTSEIVDALKRIK